MDLTTSGVEARRRLLHEVFDLVVCDLLMPELDGKGLYREILQRRPHAADKVHLHHRRYRRSRVLPVRRKQRRPLVTKPFTRVELLQAVYEKLEIDIEVPAQVATAAH